MYICDACYLNWVQGFPPRSYVIVSQVGSYMVIDSMYNIDQLYSHIDKDNNFLPATDIEASSALRTMEQEQIGYHNLDPV